MAGNREFGLRVRSLREAKKLDNPAFSLRKFAQDVGVSATFMSKVETGDFGPPSPERIKRMAELLGVDADELLALARKVDPELSSIIRDQPRAMADFLRTASASGLTDEELRAITDEIRKRKADSQQSQEPKDPQEPRD